MKWRKSPESLIQTFAKALPTNPAIEPRKMFGYPCAFTGGHMFAGLHQENLILRLSETERETFLRLPETGIFEPMPGRKMREYVVVPPSLLEDEKSLRRWVELSFRYAQSLPPKIKKPKAGGR